MTIQITQTHLAFVKQAKDSFETNPLQVTYRDKRNFDLIALRMGEDRDCILVYELGESIANFAQQIAPSPYPRKEVNAFALDMEKQLLVNDHKGGWSNEHHEFLSQQLGKHVIRLSNELNKVDKDKHEITILCANIANFAMMIAGNEGEHL